MIKAGILGEDDSVELIAGQIVTQMPIGTAHSSLVGRLTMLLTSRVSDRAIVWVQNPIALDPISEPEPDLALLRPRPDFYATEHPGPQDVLLIMEVADTSLGLRKLRYVPETMASFAERRRGFALHSFPLAIRSSDFRFVLTLRHHKRLHLGIHCHQQ